MSVVLRVCVCFQSLPFVFCGIQLLDSVEWSKGCLYFSNRKCNQVPCVFLSPTRKAITPQASICSQSRCKFWPSFPFLVPSLFTFFYLVYTKLWPCFRVRFPLYCETISSIFSSRLQYFCQTCSRWVGSNHDHASQKGGRLFFSVYRFRSTCHWLPVGFNWIKPDRWKNIQLINQMYISFSSCLPDDLWITKWIKQANHLHWRAAFLCHSCFCSIERPNQRYYHSSTLSIQPTSPHWSHQFGDQLYHFVSFVVPWIILLLPSYFPLLLSPIHLTPTPHKVCRISFFRL